MAAIKPDSGTPEAVALALLDRIAGAEGKSFDKATTRATGFTPAEPKWILDTYAECLEAAAGRRS